MLNFAQIRTVILFVVGVGGVVYELVVTGTDRPALLVLLGMFAGLPLVLNVDKMIQGVNPSKQPTSPVEDKKAQPDKEAAT